MAALGTQDGSAWHTGWQRLAHRMAALGTQGGQARHAGRSVGQMLAHALPPAVCRCVSQKMAQDRRTGGPSEPAFCVHKTCTALHVQQRRARAWCRQGGAEPAAGSHSKART